MLPKCCKFLQFAFFFLVGVWRRNFTTKRDFSHPLLPSIPSWRVTFSFPAFVTTPTYFSRRKTFHAGHPRRAIFSFSSTLLNSCMKQPNASLESFFFTLFCLTRPEKTWYYRERKQRWNNLSTSKHKHTLRAETAEASSTQEFSKHSAAGWIPNIWLFTAKKIHIFRTGRKRLWTKGNF